MAKIWAKMFAMMRDLGLDKDKFHAYLKSHYKTDHLSSLKDSQQEEIIEGLKWYEKHPKELEALKEKLK
jgi:hypothetical protein